ARDALLADLRLFRAGELFVRNRAYSLSAYPENPDSVTGLINNSCAGIQLLEQLQSDVLDSTGNGALPEGPFHAKAASLIARNMYGRNTNWVLDNTFTGQDFRAFNTYALELISSLWERLDPAAPGSLYPDAHEQITLAWFMDTYILPGTVGPLEKWDGMALPPIDFSATWWESQTEFDVLPGHQPPVWADYQRRYSRTLRNAARWWSTFPQNRDGQLGGGLGDDSEAAALIVPNVTRTEWPENSVETGWRAVLDAHLYGSPVDPDEGYHIVVIDAEHGAEFTSYPLFFLMPMNFGGPKYIEYAMRTDLGKPAGILPPSVNFNSSALGDGTNWYTSNGPNGGGVCKWYFEQYYQMFVAARGQTPGSPERIALLEPLATAINWLFNHPSPIVDENNPPPVEGTDDWTAWKTHDSIARMAFLAREELLSEPSLAVNPVELEWVIDNESSFYTQYLNMPGPTKAKDGMEDLFELDSVWLRHFFAMATKTVLYSDPSGGQILWNENTNGLGDFGPTGIIEASAGVPLTPLAVDLADDGDLDVLYAISLADQIVWRANDGLGDFGPRQVITTAVDKPGAVDVADLNGDGYLDLLSAAGRDGFAWFANSTGAGSFGVLQPVDAGNTIRGLAVGTADIDGDGDLDMLGLLPSSALADYGVPVWFENLDGLGSLLVFGGYDESGTHRTNTVFRFHIASDAWSVAILLPIEPGSDDRFSDQRAVLGADEQIWVMGGINGVNPAAGTTIALDSMGAFSIPAVPGGGGPYTVYAQVVYPDASQFANWGMSNALEIEFGL
ncbi:MAG: hypothetical protein ACI9EF_002443, partial [Pseudohongiellaceae bacterium]